AGLVLGVLGRQTAVPVGFAAALWVAFSPAWLHVRYRYAAVTALAPVGIWLALHFGTMSFSFGERGGVHALTIVGYLSDPSGLAGHLGRVVIAVVVPWALIAGAWIRTRGDVPRGALLVAAVIVLQPVALGPTSAGDNEPRLAALSLPALAVAAGA